MEAEILQGWKSVASYLQRDERTVRRWEKLYGLPMRRITSDGRSVVYAVPKELDDWLLQPRVPENGASIHAPLSAHEQVPLTMAVPANVSGSPVALELTLPRDWVLPTVAALVLLLLPAFLAIARSVKAGMPWEKVSAANRSVMDEEILKAEFLLEQRTPESLKHAQSAFEARSEQLPRSASAYAGLAKTYCLLREYSMMPSSEAFPLSRSAAQKALEIDPQNPTAHAVMGFVSFFWGWDALASERNFLEAERLAPDDPLAYQWYGSVLMHQGRMTEALQQLNEAQRLAPSSASIVAVKAMALGLAGQRESAVEILHEVEAAAPNAPAPHRALAFVSLLAPFDLPTFLAESIQFAKLRNDNAALDQATRASEVYRLQGERSMWSFLLSDERNRADTAMPTFRQAELEAMLGDDESAIAHLSLLREQHEEHVLGISVSPLFLRLRRTGRLAPFLDAAVTTRRIDLPVR